MIQTAVVILNYNGEDFLRRFLPSVIRYTPDATIVVADNGSTDQSVSLLRHDFPTVRLICFSENYGFCGGYNKALAQIEERYLVLLNSDVEVTPGWLSPIIALMERRSDVAAVQPKILSWHNRDFFEYAGAGGGMIDTLGYPFCRGRVFDYVEPDEGQYDDIAEIFWATGACLVIRSDVYRRFGGLDEDFFAHMEEIDLCWKIGRAGMKIMYFGQSHVYHVGAGTLPKNNPRKTYLNFRNGLTLVFKHFSPRSIWYKFPLRLVLDHVAALRFLFSSPADAKAVWKAHAHFFSMFGKTRKKRKQLGNLPYAVPIVYAGSILWDYYIKKKKKIF